MPVVALPIAGPTNTLLSLNADAERTINFYVEQVTPGQGKSPDYLIGTPGLTIAQTLGDSPVRALFQQDGRAFAVAGGSFYELTSATTNTFRGNVTSDSNLATMASNGSAGHQLAITSGGNFYIFDLNANTLSTVVTGLEPVVMVEFMDGYFLVNTANTRRFGWSALEDGTSWSGLDIAERSEASDNISALIRSHRELWVIGSQTSEVWYDQGDALNPFAPIQGVFIEQGCNVNSAFTARRIDNSLVWGGTNADGFGVIWKANGYTPQRISTHAVELAIQTYGLSGARSWVYQDDGHLFYVLMQPTAPTAQVYDVATGIWHERATWDSTHYVWLPPRGQCYCYAFGAQLVGDRLTGTIYQQSLTFFTEQLAAH